MTTTTAGSKVSTMSNATTPNASKTTSTTLASMTISNAGKPKLGYPHASGMTGNAGSRPNTWKCFATRKTDTNACPLSTVSLAVKLMRNVGGRL